MGFAQDLKEFVAGVKSGYDMSMKSNEFELKQKELASLDAYRKRDTRTPAQKEKDAAESHFNQLMEGKKPSGVETGEETGGEGSDAGNVTMSASGEGGEGAGAPISYEQLKKNMFSMESGGNYKAIGPTHPTLGRALGIGQVMEANLPKWSQAALGRVVSADEFLNNPKVQDAIIDHRLGGYYRQHGPAGASSKWFTGSPTPKGKRDSLGTRDYDYVRRATKTAALPIDPEDEEYGSPIVFAASGGLIDDQYAGNDESGGSNPAVRDAVEGNDYNPRDIIDNGPDLGDMIADGVDAIQKDLSPEGQGVDTNADLRVEAFAKNIGAPSSKDVQQMEDAVDPKKKLPDALRPVAAWKGMYDYYTKLGKPVEAQRAAKAMLMYTRAVLTQGGYMAQAAAEKGDLKGAANAIAGAVNKAPDGKRMEIGEATKNGVKFKIWDETTGEMTEEGEAKQDQIIKMATGLANGTEFMRGIGAIRPKTVDKVAVRAEQERAALEDFAKKSGKGVINEFMAGLEDDEARASFSKLPAKEQFRIAQADAQADRADAAQKGIQSRYDRSRLDSAWKEAIKHERWEMDRERLMTKDEIAISQRQQDLDDRNSRFDQSMEARKARQRQHDAAVLARREAAAKRGGSAGERADMAIDRDRNVAQQDVYRTGDPNDELGVDTGTQSRLQAVDVGAGFNKMANDPSRKIDRDMVKELPNAITTEWEAAAKDEKGNLRKDYKPPTRQQTMLLTDIASDIMRGDFDQTRAAQLAIDATSPGAKVVPQRDGTVTINGGPPVRLSERSFLELARIHGRTGNINKKGLGPEAAIPEATPTGNRSSGGGWFGGTFDPVPREEQIRQSAGAPSISDTGPIDIREGVPLASNSLRPPTERATIRPDPPAHQAATSSKYDKNPTRRRKETIAAIDPDRMERYPRSAKLVELERRIQEERRRLQQAAGSR